MSGHVFVTRGDITRLNVDAWLLPTDRTVEISTSWLANLHPDVEASIEAGVDAAMRRRFAFVPLHPSEPPTQDVLRRWLVATGRDGGVADLLDELNRRIEDDDFKIGPSYFMRDAVHSNGGLERAWRTAILPLLEEHHYGDGVDVRQRYGLEAIRSRVAK